MEGGFCNFCPFTLLGVKIDGLVRINGSCTSKVCSVLFDLKCCTFESSRVAGFLLHCNHLASVSGLCDWLGTVATSGHVFSDADASANGAGIGRFGRAGGRRLARCCYGRERRRGEQPQSVSGAALCSQQRKQPRCVGRGGRRVDRPLGGSEQNFCSEILKHFNYYMLSPAAICGALSRRSSASSRRRRAAAQTSAARRPRRAQSCQSAR